MLMKKPYKVSPFTALVKMKCPWIADVKSRTTKRIAEFEKFIEEEAAADHLTKMADADYVYDCFKYNLEHNLKFGMIQVLKYFSYQFRIKILYDMVGVWKFTDRDVEMYNFFRSTTMFEGMKEWDVIVKLRPISGEAPDIFTHDSSCKWVVTIGNKKEFYSNFFHQEIVMMHDMLRHVKGNPLIMPYRTFDDGGHLHEGLNLREPIDFEEYQDLKVA